MNRRELLQAVSAMSVTLAMPQVGLADNHDAPFAMSSRNILGERMALVDKGEGRPVVFLHGNPTSSYLWRNILPYASDDHRVIAPDLIGMGQSSKPEIAYSYDDHARYLHALLDDLDLQDTILVIHDWGSALGLDWAMQNPERVAGIAFMEAILPPVMPFESYEAFGEFGEMFRAWQTPGVGEKMILDENMFLDVVLKQLGVATPLTDEVMANYNAPYPTPESRAPLLAWPREVPFADKPKDVADKIRAYSDWFLESDIPKLMFSVTPGALMPPSAVEWLESRLRNVETVDLGPGAHFVQEDHPHAIGEALADWLTRI